jgi:hypothetical protein
VAMSTLAAAIYKFLRERVPSEDPTISYKDLIEELGSLPSPNQRLQPHDRRLIVAIGEGGEEPPMASLATPRVWTSNALSLG